jgi:hypothetical protein
VPFDQPNFPQFLVLVHTSIMGNQEAGIFLDDNGAPIPGGTVQRGAPTTTTQDGVVIQNVKIGGPTSNFQNFNLDLSDFWTQGNKIGILISGDSPFGNRIGGTEQGEGNEINYSNQAGIRIENSHINPTAANRIAGNSVLGSFPINFTPDLSGDMPEWMCIYGNNSSGHIIGGEGAGEGNRIRNNHAGILVRNSENIRIVNNEVGPDDEGGTVIDEGGMRAGGIILVDSSNCQVGPKNTLLDNGDDPFDDGSPLLGAIYVEGGSSNNIHGNWIGTDASESNLLGNNPSGIWVKDSDQNMIGDVGGNVIVSSEEGGIVLEGNSALNNIVGNNSIGVGSRGTNLFRPNRRHGIYIHAGASSNKIGSALPFQLKGTTLNINEGNFIHDNLGDGIRVDGAETLGNIIQFNSITNHSLPNLGIETVNGGNAEIPPPVIISDVNGRVMGTVDSSAIPDGSTVQIFSDREGFGPGLRGGRCCE